MYVYIYIYIQCVCIYIYFKLMIWSIAARIISKSKKIGEYQWHATTPLSYILPVFQWIATQMNFPLCPWPRLVVALKHEVVLTICMTICRQWLYFAMEFELGTTIIAKHIPIGKSWKRTQVTTQFHKMLKDKYHSKWLARWKNEGFGIVCWMYWNSHKGPTKIIRCKSSQHVLLHSTHCTCI